MAILASTTEHQLITLQTARVILYRFKSRLRLRLINSLSKFHFEKPFLKTDPLRFKITAMQKNYDFSLRKHICLKTHVSIRSTSMSSSQRLEKIFTKPRSIGTTFLIKKSSRSLSGLKISTLYPANRNVWTKGKMITPRSKKNKHYP